MPQLGIHKAGDVKQTEWLVAKALDWRCLALTPANFLDQLLCDAWHGPLFFPQQCNAHIFACVREYAVLLLSSTMTGMPCVSSFQCFFLWFSDLVLA